jgi:DNA-binding XRE family transcriptional regulator
MRLYSPQYDIMVNTPKRIIGSGKEAVYLYYYENDRILATLEGRDRWECKIGKSHSRSSTRVWNQVKTELARGPILEIEARTNHSYSLESMIHSHLSPKRIFGCGREWFMTNPDEFEHAFTASQKTIEGVRDVCNFVPEGFMLYIDSLENLSHGISQARNEAGFTQYELGLLSNVRQGTISMLENEGHKAKFSTIWKVLNSLGYSVIFVKENHPPA